mmetsp:Transcript_67991/g.220108  ORF Transcript_67991/g.220108 Transcript_67991/m.220108 type:complete len:112 (-) Transcript_67991:114-449(-)
MARRFVHADAQDARSRCRVSSSSSVGACLQHVFAADLHISTCAFALLQHVGHPRAEHRGVEHGKLPSGEPIVEYTSNWSPHWEVYSVRLAPACSRSCVGARFDIVWWLWEG